MNSGKIKFVQGDGRFESFNAYAREEVEKMMEEDFAETPQESFQESNENFQQELCLHNGQMCFHEGADGMGEDLPLQENMHQEEDGFCEDNLETVLQQNNVQRPQSPVRPAQLAQQVYVKLLVLRNQYQALQRFGTEFSDELAQMIDELTIMIFAMGRIYQSLARTNQLPKANSQPKPQFRSFCSGLKITSSHLRGLLYDLRQLQRSVDNQNISVQLLIISTTLMDQQQQLFIMQQTCVQPR